MKLAAGQAVDWYQFFTSFCRPVAIKPAVVFRVLAHDRVQIIVDGEQKKRTVASENVKVRTL